MSDEMMAILCDLKEGQGRIEAKVDGTMKWMEKHVIDDKEMAASIRNLEISPLAGQVKALELSQARQKGALRILAGLGSIIGAGIGYAVDLLTRGGHH
jgi:hypothetical protein